MLSNLNPKILVAGLVMLIVAGSIPLLILISGNEERSRERADLSEYLIQSEGEEKRNWLREISEYPLSSNRKIVKNIYDDYQITVPKDWTVEDGETPGWKLNIHRGGGYDSSRYSGIIDGTLLRISTFDNFEDVSIPDWARESPEANQIFQPNTDFFRTEYLERDVYFSTGELYIFGEDSEGTPVENSSVEHIAFKEGGRIYVISCITIDEQSGGAEMCIDQANSFTVLNIERNELSLHTPHDGGTFEVYLNDTNRRTKESSYIIYAKTYTKAQSEKPEGAFEDIVLEAINWIESLGIDASTVDYDFTITNPNFLEQTPEIKFNAREPGEEHPHGGSNEEGRFKTREF